MESTDSNRENKESPDFVIGTTVFKKYKILSYLASGAKGRVYRAQDILLDIPIALKVLIRDSGSDRQIVRFQSEAKLASKLRHRNIATIYDFGLYEGTPYLAMEFVDGESLQDSLDRDGPLPLSYVVEVSIQVTNALIYAHSQNIVHRDIKPANIVVSNKNTEPIAKILDFGVAKRLDVALTSQDGKVTLTGDLLGSPLYMSPEQSKGENLTPAADAYSLGCMIWTCLVGEPPLSGDTIMETLALVQNKTPESIKTHVENLPQELVNVIDRLLEKKADLRPGLEKEVLPLLLKLQEPFPLIDAYVNVDRIAQQASQPATSHSMNYKAFSLFLLVALVLSVGVFFRLSPIEQPHMVPVELAPFSVGAGKSFRAGLMVKDNSLIVYDSTDKELERYSVPKNIEEVQVRDSDLTDRCFSVFATYPKLKKITIINSDIRELDGLDKVTELEALKITRTRITTRSMDRIAGLKKLRQLFLSKSGNLTDAELSKIGKVSTLESLGLNSYRDLKFNNVKGLLNLRRLNSLDVSESEITVEGVRKIVSGLPDLATIVITDCPKISTEQLKALALEFPDRMFFPDASLLSKLQVEIQAASNNENYPVAIEKAKQRVGLLIQVGGEHNPELVHQYDSIGLFYARLSDFDQARRWYRKALELALLKGNTEEQLHAYSGLDHVAIYEAHNKLDPKLEQSLMKTHAFAERTMSPTSLGMASRLVHMGDTYKICRRFPESILWLRKGLSVYDKLNDPKAPPLTAQAHIHLADVLLEVGKLDEAEKETTIGIEQFIALPRLPGNYRSDYCHAYASLARIAVCRQDYQRALEQNDKAFAEIKRLNVVAQRVLREVYKQRAMILTKLGQDDAAADNLRTLRYHLGKDQN